MKRAFIAASAIAILAGAQAFAQTVGVGPADTVVIEPEQCTDDQGVRREGESCPGDG